MSRLIFLCAIFAALAFTACGGEEETAHNSALALCLEDAGLSAEIEDTEGVEVVSGVEPTEKLSVSDPDSSGSLVSVYSFDNDSDATAAAQAEGGTTGREGLVTWLYPSFGDPVPLGISLALKDCAKQTT